MKFKVVCDQCKSDLIEAARIEDSPLVITMREWIKREQNPQAEPAVHYKQQWRLTCLDCGYTIEYAI